MANEEVSECISNNGISSTNLKCHICSKEFDQFELKIHVIEDYDDESYPFRLYIPM